MLKKWILAVISLFIALQATAQLSDYAYLYIEGDKETPFYVKMEGKMLPRLGQNYTIIPHLDAGVTNIEILFQQNKYQPLKFAISIPKDVSRGLLLRQVEGNFVLYDLQTGKYIFPGNKATDDDITALENQFARNRQLAAQQQADVVAQTATKTPVKETVVAKKEEEQLPSFNPEKEKKTKPAKVVKKPKAEKVKATKPKENLAITAPKTTTKKQTESTTKPKRKYLDNVVINDNNESGNETEETEDNNTKPVGSSNNCQTAMGDKEFESYLEKLKSRDDENRIKYIQKSKKQCFSTEQISYIGRAIPSSSGRLQVLKQLYRQTTDKQNYPMLEHLFKTEFLKKKFKESIPQE